MAQFILKDSKGKEQTFDHETIYVCDAEGNLLPFTHGTGNPAWKNILPKAEVNGFALDSNFGAFSPGFVYPANFTLKSGETYKVSWDGEDRECVAFGFTNQGASIVAIGNGSSLGLSGNGEPFLITYNQTYSNTQLFSTDNKESHTVGIWEKVVATSDDVRYVTFMSHDGSVEYGKKAVAVGDDCADPIARGVFGTPTRESDAQYNYTFYGWATEPNGGAVANWNKAINEDKTVYANFASAVRYYTVTYYDSDGTTVLKTESLAYGTVPSYAPEKDGYKFVAWEPELVEVTGDASYVSSWVEQLKLADYTWAQLDAMPLEEAKENFAVGDVKDGYVLVGFEHDTKPDGTKTKMTFIANSLSQSYSQHSISASTFYSNTWNVVKNIKNVPTTFVPNYSLISAVAKEVVKKYVSNRETGTIATVTEKIWIPSASEFGYAPDGTNIMDEGAAYECFNEVSFGDSLSVKFTVNFNRNFSLGNRLTRTFNATGVIYLNSGKATNLTNGNKLSSAYATIGFCI